tara:strand:- start:4146 stop:4376 length:231 start_codon:yes stop_codon:yes gene_type:complete
LGRLISFSQLGAKQWETTSFRVFDIAKSFYTLRQGFAKRKAIRLSRFVVMIGKMFYIKARIIKFLGLWLALGSNNL